VNHRSLQHPQSIHPEYNPFIQRSGPNIMAPTSLTVLHSAFLTLTSVTLGRLITDTSNPSQDFWPETSTPMDPTQIDKRDFTAYHDTMTNEKSDELKAKLTKFVTGDISSEKSSTNDISTSTSYVYSLFQPRATFTKLCADSATKQWIESTLKDCPIFFGGGVGYCFGCCCETECV